MLALVLALTLPTDTARAVREGAASRAVALEGVVTFAPRPTRYFYLADATGGVRVEWPGNDRELAPGDTVRVSGTVTAGTFQSFVTAFAVTTAAPPPTLRPHLFNLSRDESDYLDANWVETEAVIQRVWVAGPWLKLDLARGRAQAVAYVPVPNGVGEKQAQALRGAAARVRGVWERTASSADPSRLLVQAVGDFEVTRPPGDLRAAPPRTVRDLMRHRADPLDARLPVRASGVVVLNLGNTRLFVRDDTGTAEAILTKPQKARVGERVTVAGFPRPDATSGPVRLDAADVLQHTPDPNAPLPAPVPGTAEDAAAGRRNGQVVKLSGTVRSARGGPVDGARRHQRRVHLHGGGAGRAPGRGRSGRHRGGDGNREPREVRGLRRHRVRAVRAAAGRGARSRAAAPSAASASASAAALVDRGPRRLPDRGPRGAAAVYRRERERVPGAGAARRSAAGWKGGSSAPRGSRSWANWPAA